MVYGFTLNSNLFFTFIIIIVKFVLTLKLDTFTLTSILFHHAFWYKKLNFSLLFFFLKKLKFRLNSLIHLGFLKRYLLLSFKEKTTN